MKRTTKSKVVATKIIDSLAEFSAALESMHADTPSHYRAGGIEAIDVIEAFGLGFSLGNVVKYVLRHGRKNPDSELSDLRKARWYLDREIHRRCKSAVESCAAKCQEAT